MRMQRVTPPSAEEQTRLTDELAARVLGWKAALDRYVKKDRTWTPKWRFAPFHQIETALLLLDTAGGAYTLIKRGNNEFTVEVHLGDRVGRASGDCMPATMTLALLAALGIPHQDQRRVPAGGPKRR